MGEIPPDKDITHKKCWAGFNEANKGIGHYIVGSAIDLAFEAPYNQIVGSCWSLRGSRFIIITITRIVFLVLLVVNLASLLVDPLTSYWVKDPPQSGLRFSLFAYAFVCCALGV